MVICKLINLKILKMKKLFLLIIAIVSFNGLLFSVETPKFDLTKDGVEPVVLNFDATFTANMIYTKIKEWIALNYKNPKTATRIDNENSMIKIGGLKEKAWKIKDTNFGNDYDNWYDLEYSLIIDIKDAKCRVTFATPEVRYKVWYNKDGSVIPKFKDSEASFENSINEMLTSLYTYIIEPPKVKKDDW